MSALFGVIPGTVKKVGDSDHPGAVKVEFSWMGGKNESYWAPVAAAMAGDGRGAYFMPEEGDEVLVAFGNGRVDDPYVIGFLWNGVDQPPASDVRIRIFRSVSGHVLEFDDRSGDEKILIKTKGGHRLLLDDTDGQAKIELFDQQGRNSLKIDTESNAIEITSQQGSITLKAPAGTIKLEAQTLELKGTQQTTLESSQSLKVSGADVTVSGQPIKLN